MGMDKKKSTPKKIISYEKSTIDLTKPLKEDNPNILVYNFLKANNLSIKIEAVEPDGGFIGDGFLLEKKPILKVVFVKN